MSLLRIGTRASRLARSQTEQVAAQLQDAVGGLEVDIKLIRTTGDRLSSADLSQLAADTKGLFVKEIEEALLENSIDVAVHSLKDLPSEMVPGLTLGAVPRREDPRDVLVTAANRPPGLEHLPKQATVATGSPRRRAQLLEARPDLEVVDIRGNVDTRLEKLKNRDIDALVLAAAGLKRLGLDSEIGECFEPDVITPAVGQGALAVQIRQGDARVAAIAETIDDESTRQAVEAERWLLAQVGGGCLLPLGALARCSAEGDSFRVFWLRPGATRTRFYAEGAAGSLHTLAQQAWEALQPAPSGRAQ